MSNNLSVRENKYARLNDLKVDLGNSLYLHYKFYQKDLFSSVKKYSILKLLDIGCRNKTYHHI